MIVFKDMSHQTPDLYSGQSTDRSNQLFGNSSSSITLSINTKDSKIDIGTSTQDSTLKQLQFESLQLMQYETQSVASAPSLEKWRLYDAIHNIVFTDNPLAGQVRKFDGALTLPLIEIEYIDLRCQFAAISVVAHDIYHIFREKSEPMKRDLFYCAAPPVAITDPPTEQKTLTEYKNLFDRYLGNVFGDDESITDEVLDNLPYFYTHKSVKRILLNEARTDCIVKLTDSYEPLTDTNKTYFNYFYRLFNQAEDVMTHPCSSCAYSADTSELVYHIKGGYSGEVSNIGYMGSFDGTDFIDFDATSLGFIANNQIAFYYLGTGF